jgi:RND family efflux transporter MFP subunit
MNPPNKRLRASAAASLALLLALTSCSKKAPEEPPARPVRVITLEASNLTDATELPGEVRSRIETRAGFLVGGRITSRQVEIGQAVTAGQVLATIDPTDTRLGAQAAAAALASARLERDQQQSDYTRYAELQRKGFVGDAELERHRNLLDAAQARFAQAQAQSAVSDNQAAYATLRAPADGVVTAIEAEVGQVIAAGQAVVRLALGSEKEVVVGIPENRLQALGHPARVRVRLWADSAAIAGRARELAPVADPATRTYALHVSLIEPPARVALGMTATVIFDGGAPTRAFVLPVSALLQQGGEAAVWRVKAQDSRVELVRVRLGAPAGNGVQVLDGLRAGDTVVTAGVHLLSPGQRVKIPAS